MATIELPNEIWLEIFSYLDDYFDLKNAMRVSKTFKSFTELPVCQKTMFRCKAVVPKGGTINLDDVETHRAFSHMSFEGDTSPGTVYFQTNDGEEAALIKTCAANEHATSPPVAFLRLQIGDSAPIPVRNKAGVTVLQVLKALCHFFSEHGTRATGGREGWTDWSDIKLDRNGNLLLQARKFLLI
jgi:hypothetical protein